MPIDSTPPPVSNDPANDGYEIRNADEAHRDADGKPRTIGRRVIDVIEDIIPGDSDHDGH